MKDNEMLSKFKTIEKLILAGFNTDEKIKKMKIDDVLNINGLNQLDIQNIKELRKAIETKKIIAFFSGGKEEK